MPKWCATYVVLRLDRERELEGWKQLHVSGIDGISCQHLQVLMTQPLLKHWEWQEDRVKNVWHDNEKKPTMYLANMDIKTAFDMARPKHIAKLVVDQDFHGWLTAALFREMADLKDHIENVTVLFQNGRGKRWDFTLRHATEDIISAVLSWGFYLTEKRTRSR